MSVRLSAHIRSPPGDSHSATVLGDILALAVLRTRALGAVRIVLIDGEILDLERCVVGPSHRGVLRPVVVVLLLSQLLLGCRKDEPDFVYPDLWLLGQAK